MRWQHIMVVAVLASAAAGQLSMQVDESSQTSGGGESVEYGLTVTNDGAATLWVDFQAIGLSEGMSAAIVYRGGFLAPGNSKNAMVKVTSAPYVPVGSYPLQLKAIPSEGIPVEVSVTYNVNSTPVTTTTLYPPTTTSSTTTTQPTTSTTVPTNETSTSTSTPSSSTSSTSSSTSTAPSTASTSSSSTTTPSSTSTAPSTTTSTETPTTTTLPPTTTTIVNITTTTSTTQPTTTTIPSSLVAEGTVYSCPGSCYDTYWFDSSSLCGGAQIGDWVGFYTGVETGNCYQIADTYCDYCWDIYPCVDLGVPVRIATNDQFKVWGLQADCLNTVPSTTTTTLAPTTTTLAPTTTTVTNATTTTQAPTTTTTPSGQILQGTVYSCWEDCANADYIDSTALCGPAQTGDYIGFATGPSAGTCVEIIDLYCDGCWNIDFNCVGFPTPLTIQPGDTFEIYATQTECATNMPSTTTTTSTTTTLAPTTTIPPTTTTRPTGMILQGTVYSCWEDCANADYIDSPSLCGGTQVGDWVGFYNGTEAGNCYEVIDIYCDYCWGDYPCIGTGLGMQLTEGDLFRVWGAQTECVNSF